MVISKDTDRLRAGSDGNPSIKIRAFEKRPNQDLKMRQPN